MQITESHIDDILSGSRNEVNHFYDSPFSNANEEISRGSRAQIGIGIVFHREEDQGLKILIKLVLCLKKLVIRNEEMKFVGMGYIYSKPTA